MANYSSFHAHFSGKKENLENFLKVFFVNDEFNYEYFQHEPEYSKRKITQTEKENSLYYFGNFRRSAPMDEMLALALEHKLKYVFADCYEGFHTTIYHQDAQGEIKEYRHEVKHYLENPNSMKLIKPFKILIPNELLFGALFYNHHPYLDKKNIIANIKKDNGEFLKYVNYLKEEPPNNPMEGVSLGEIYSLNENYNNWDSVCDEVLTKFDSLKSLLFFQNNKINLPSIKVKGL